MLDEISESVQNYRHIELSPPQINDNNISQMNLKNEVVIVIITYGH